MHESDSSWSGARRAAWEGLGGGWPPAHAADTHPWSSLSCGKPLCPEERESGLGVYQELQERTGLLGSFPAPWYHFCLAHLSSCVPSPWGAWVPVEELRPGVGGGLSPSTAQDEWAGTQCPPPALRRGVRGRARGGRCRHVGLPAAGACTGVSLCVEHSHAGIVAHRHAVCERIRVQGSAHMHLCVHVPFCLSNKYLQRAGQAAWVGSAHTGEDVQVAFSVQMYTSVSVCTYTHMHICTDQCVCMRACINTCATHTYAHVSLNLLCVPRYAGTSVCPCGSYTGVCVSVPVRSAGCCPWTCARGQARMPGGGARVRGAGCSHPSEAVPLRT